MSCVTGLGVSMVCADADVKFSATEAWKITRIGGLNRSVVVIDDSHLGLTSGATKQYCFGDLVDLSPMAVDVQVDAESTDVFEAQASGAKATTPLPLGEIPGASNEMILTLPSQTYATGAKLTMTGAFVGDSGFSLSNNDRLRATLQWHPDGKTFVWAAPTNT